VGGKGGGGEAGRSKRGDLDIETPRSKLFKPTKDRKAVGGGTRKKRKVGPGGGVGGSLYQKLGIGELKDISMPENGGVLNFLSPQESRKRGLLGGGKETVFQTIVMKKLEGTKATSSEGISNKSRRKRNQKSARDLVRGVLRHRAREKIVGPTVDIRQSRAGV